MKTLLNTPDELHAFVIGILETFCPWKPHYKDNLPPPKYLYKEYHYYLAGRALGFLALLLALVGIAKLIQELLL